jgi:hypothetical protein
VIFRFGQVRFEAFLEFGIGRFLDDVGQGFEDFVVGIIYFAQRVDEDVVHSLDVFCK